MKVILFILIAVSSLLADLSRSGEIINDSVTGLAWQDDAIVKTSQIEWLGAVDYCENTLNLGGHNDWRLPNEKELLTIVDRSRYYPSIDNTVFVNTASDNYWSSTTYVFNTEYAWNVRFYNRLLLKPYHSISHFLPLRQSLHQG